MVSDIVFNMFRAQKSGCIREDIIDGFCKSTFVVTANTDVDALYIAVQASFHVRKECVERKIGRVPMEEDWSQKYKIVSRWFVTTFLFLHTKFVTYAGQRLNVLSTPIVQDGSAYN